MSPGRLLGALWTWRAWIPLALVLGPAWTAVHEGAHALAAIAQGGELLEWTIVPSRSPEGEWRFGYMSHTLVPDLELVVLAPTIASFLLAIPAAFALRRTPEGRASRFAFLMTVLFPIGDVSLATAGLAFQREEADLARVLGGWELIGVPLLLAAMTSVGYLARPAFERHFRTGLSLAEYALVGSAVVGVPWVAGVLLHSARFPVP